MYVTDALKAITENTTHFLIPGVGAADYGTSLRMRYADLLDPTPKEPEAPEDTRSAKEIAADMWTRIRGKKQEQ